MPSSLVSGRLKVENAYACPIERCTARAAGGTKNRLKPGGATVLSRSRNEDVMGSPALFVVRGNPVVNMPRAPGVVTSARPRLERVICQEGEGSMGAA